MRNRIALLIAVVVIIVLAGFGYLYWHQEIKPEAAQNEEQSLPPQPVTAPDNLADSTAATEDESSQPTASEQPNERPAQPAAAGPKGPQPLFSADSIDVAQNNFHDWLDSHTNNPATSIINMDGLLERVVATVDSINHDELSYRLLPVKRPGGQYQTIHVEGKTYPANNNHHRYEPYLELVNTFDVDTWVDIYQTMYPALQQQYQRLGYPDGNFNEELKGALRKLLATPDIDYTPQLNQPKVTYQFANDKLEQLPPAQKALLRLDQSTRSKLKQQLAALLAKIEQLPAEQFTR